VVVPPDALVVAGAAEEDRAELIAAELARVEVEAAAAGALVVVRVVGATEVARVEVVLVLAFEVEVTLVAVLGFTDEAAATDEALVVEVTTTALFAAGTLDDDDDAAGLPKYPSQTWVHWFHEVTYDPPVVVVA
jgi:hypothetical protein